MNMSIDKKKYSSTLPTNWPTRDEISRKNSNTLPPSSGKVDVYYYRLFFYTVYNN